MEFTGFEMFDDFNDQTMCEDVKNKLKEKYNKEFEVLRIGNRIGGESTDRIDTYCVPIDNNKCIFTTTLDLDMEGKDIEKDDYYLKQVTTPIDSFFEEEFSKNGVGAICRTDTIKKNTLDENLETQRFIDKYPNAKFLSMMAIEEIDKYKIQDIYSLLSSTYENIKLNSIIYVVEKETLEKLKEKLYGFPYIPKTLLEKNSNYKLYMKIENGQVLEIIGE
jgi:hypothetical protein